MRRSHIMLVGIILAIAACVVLFWEHGTIVLALLAFVFLSSGIEPRVIMLALTLWPWLVVGLAFVIVWWIYRKRDNSRRQ